MDAAQYTRKLKKILRDAGYTARVTSDTRYRVGATSAVDQCSDREAIAAYLEGCLGTDAEIRVRPGTDFIWVSWKEVDPARLGV